tara:strand:+ start:252 stop:1046 length:795 start_codon:yes stop_codon:yes gene_type:complete
MNQIDLFTENLIKFPKKKELFGEKIILSDLCTDDTYPEDISPMFRWMKKINFPTKPTILDIGANVGIYSLSYASLFKGAIIHSFEPVNFIYSILRKNLEINPNLSSNIKTHNFGLSNCVEKKRLSIPTPHQHLRYSNSIDIRLYSVFGKGKEKFDAKFLPLDLWINQNPINALDFIKIDVEGYEYFVLDGAKKTLNLFRPIVMFELNNLTLTLSKKTADEYIRFAKNIGYNVFGLQYGFKSELLEIKSAEQVDLVSDIILLPRS